MTLTQILARETARTDRRLIEAGHEGVVFHNLKTGQMAKLRLDMLSKMEKARIKKFRNKR